MATTCDWCMGEVGVRMCKCGTDACVDCWVAETDECHDCHVRRAGDGLDEVDGADDPDEPTRRRDVP